MHLRIRTVPIAVAALAFVAVAAQATPKIKRAFAVQYPAAKGTRIDDCTTCHTTGSTLNPYGLGLQKAGAKFDAIEKDDSDGDKVVNLAEIKALSNPGNAEDTPGKPAKRDSTAAKPDSAKGAARDTAAAPADTTKR